MIEELLLSKWAQVREGLLVTARKFSDAELVYKPFDGGYSVAETMLHIGHEEEIEVRYGLARSVTELPDPLDPAQYRDVEAVVAVLTETHERTLKFLETLSDADLVAETETPWGATTRRIDMLWHVLEHEIHHRGELSLILGLLGREGLDA